MIGRPIQLKPYTYLASQPLRSHAREISRNASGEPIGYAVFPPVDDVSTIPRSKSILSIYGFPIVVDEIGNARQHRRRPVVEVVLEPRGICCETGDWRGTSVDVTTRPRR